MRHRKSLYIILVLALLCSFTSCAQAPSDTGVITLTLGTYGTTYLPVVNQFNEAQNVYAIEYVDYSQEGLISLENAVVTLNADLASGNGPDIILSWDFKIEPSLYGEKGYFEDLYTFLDTDPELSREDFVESLFTAYEADGKLYQTLPGFGVMTIIGPESLTSSISEWTFADLTELAKQNGGSSIFMGGLPQNEFLSSCMTVALGDFVDFETGTADFDNGYFKSVLEFANALEENSAETESSAMLRFYCLSSFMELQYFEAMYGEKVGVLGYPSKNGGVIYFANVMDQYSINKNSDNKDGAWQFVRLLLTEEYQLRNIAFQIPSNLTAMQEMIDYSTTPLYSEDSDGNKVEITARGNVDFEYHAATSGQIEQMLDIINSATVPARSDSTITNIVLEEAAAYFSGDKTVDETAALIQSRAALYLGELA